MWFLCHCFYECALACCLASILSSIQVTTVVMKFFCWSAIHQINYCRFLPPFLNYLFINVCQEYCIDVYKLWCFINSLVSNTWPVCNLIIIKLQWYCSAHFRVVNQRFSSVLCCFNCTSAIVCLLVAFFEFAVVKSLRVEKFTFSSQPFNNYYCLWEVFLYFHNWLFFLLQLRLVWVLWKRKIGLAVLMCFFPQ